MRAQTVIFAVVAATVILAPRAGAQEASFGGETTVTLVEVPVRVIRQGRPVRGLTASDFSILDEGIPREIASFEVLDLGAESPPPELSMETWGVPTPPANRRNFVFLVDLVNFSTPAALRDRVVPALRGMVDQRMGPEDRAAIYLFRGRTSLAQVIDFTSSHERCHRAIDLLAALIDGDAARVKSLVGQLHGGVRATGEAVEQRFRELFKREHWPNDSMVRALSRAMARFGKGTRHLVGQKYLVFLSTGYSGMGQARVLRETDEILEILRRESWTVMSVNTGGLGFGRDSLFRLADETGGEVFTNTHRLDVLLEEMADRTEMVYLLAFEPTGLAADGRLRRIRVKLSGAIKGARVLHRSGYYAPRPPPGP